MSDKVYFTDKYSSFSRFLIRITSGVFHTVYPSGAEKHVRRILTSPPKKIPADIPDDIQSHALATQHGELMTYSIGKGPTILFVHGWSGSGSQFFKLMKVVADQGFRAVTFDHYKHGLSCGKECHYPLFVYSLNELANYLYNEHTLFGIVSHSMGSTACLDVFKKRSIPQFLIAPLFNFYEELVTRVSKAGISPIIFETIINRIEAEFKTTIRDHDSIRNIHSVISPITILHSERDTISRYDFSERLAKTRKNITLHPVDNTGHMRIISAPETKKLLINFINKSATASLEID